MHSTARVVVCVSLISDEQVAASTGANLRAGWLPTKPVSLDLCGGAIGSNLARVPSCHLIKQVVPAVKSPIRPGGYALAFHRHIMLMKVSTAGPVPSIVVVGDVDPRLDATDLRVLFKVQTQQPGCLILLLT